MRASFVCVCVFAGVRAPVVSVCVWVSRVALRASSGYVCACCLSMCAGVVCRCFCACVFCVCACVCAPVVYVRLFRLYVYV